MNFLEILGEGFLGSVNSILNIAKIVIPLMIFLEFGKNYKLIDKISLKFEPFTQKIGMSKNASLPLLVGLIFGISYGAGVLIQSAKDGDLSEVDQILLVTFLIMCHAVFEDTLLFVAIGANGFILLISRVLIAFLLVLVVNSRVKLVEKNVNNRNVL